MLRSYAERVPFLIYDIGRAAKVSDAAIDPHAFLRLPLDSQVQSRLVGETAVTLIMLIFSFLNERLCVI
jgi:hypothetical protein